MNGKRWGAWIAFAIALLITFSSALMAAEGARPGVNFNHDQTKFSLTGMHTNTACESCHVKGVFKGTPTSCTDCHNRGGSVNAQMKPATHIPATQDCSACHTPQGWLPSTFTHAGITKSCATCHNGTTQTGKPAGHLQTTKDCVECHKTTAWIPAGMDHGSLTPPAAGRCSDCHGRNATGKPAAHVHTTAQCDTCHRSTSTWLPASYSHAPGDTDCQTCHNGSTATGKTAQHIRTTDQCSVCHTQAGWIPTSFAHTAAQVAGRACADCHNGVGARGVTAKHIPVAGRACDSCHTTNGWVPTSFDHSKVGITGSAGDSCTSCHNGTNASGKPAVHIPTTGYPQCVSCHTITAWKPTTFNHSGVTAADNCSTCHNGTSASGRPTSGAKAHTIAPMTSVTCGSCHRVGGGWAPATMNHTGVTSCSSCHAISSAGNAWTPGKASHISTTGHAQCSDCHTTSVWKPSTFSHQGISASSNCTVSCHNGTNATGRPVSGAKAHTVSPMTSTSCGSCHTVGTSWFPATMNHTGITTCTTCHTYAGNSWTPSKVTHLSTTAQCASCHTTRAWLPATFSHTTAGVTAATNCAQSGCHDTANAAAPRAGQPTAGSRAHTVAPMNSTTCATCHTIGGTWLPATMKHTGATNCEGCHSKLGNQWTLTPSPTHLPTSSPCSNCHTTTAWKPATFRHDGVTAATTCAQSGCHDTVNKATPGAGRPTSGTKAHTIAPMTSGTCGDCHAIGTNWTPATMNHAGLTSCTSCHATAGNGFTPAKTNHISTTGYAQCSSCHLTTAWLPTTFDHATAGVTAATDCTTCHNGTSATGRPSSGAKAHTVAPMTNATCANCHTVGISWTPTNMNHAAGNTSSCTSCHAISAAGNNWTPGKANHIATTGYAQCSSCHTTSAWMPTSFAHNGVDPAGNCTTCHNGTSATGVPTSGTKAHTVAPMTNTTCGSCHTMGTAWTSAVMNHTGATNCTACHTFAGNGFTPVKSNHVSTASQCSACHLTSAWLPATVTHNGVTAATDCFTGCHNTATTSAPRAGRPTSGAKAHTIAPMTGNTCGSCHAIGTAWTPAVMNHTGATNCSSCHSKTGNGWTPTPTSHITTTSQCSACHTTSVWRPATFSHSTNGITAATDCTQSGCHNTVNAAAPRAGRPTSGAKAHAFAPMTSNTCASCHAIGTSWAPAAMNHTGATNCSSCHATTGNGWTPTPAVTHITTASQCSTCHSTAAWKPATGTHNGVTSATDCFNGCHNGTSATGRPVTGTKAHTQAPLTNNTCGSCHAIGTSWVPATMNHTGLTGCTSCHATAGNGFTPAKANHIAYSTSTYPQCSSCHLTTAWLPTSFSHAGITAADNCTTCHNGTAASGTPAGAKAHTTAPMTANTCASCHTIGGGWLPATMNHSGATLCSSCHVTGGNNWTIAKPSHISTSGAQCSNCHLTTAWLPTSFAHSGVTASDNCTTCHNGTSATGRPSSGTKAHTVAPLTSNTCGSCHTVGNAWSPATMDHTGLTSCTTCHTYSGNGFTPAKANHLSTSSQCSSCHLTTAWLPATFNHAANGVTAATNCTQAGCHATPDAATPKAGRPATGAKAHTFAPMTSNTCANCHTGFSAWTGAAMNHSGAVACSSCHSYSANPSGWTVGSPKATHPSTTSQCSTCHSTTTWLGAKVNHASYTAATNCAQSGCHNTPGQASPAGTPLGAKAHTVAPMTSTACGTCHLIGSTWTPATMNHTGLTSCTSCHATGGNGFTPAAVNHISTAGYAQCSSCHTTSVWKPTLFNHTGVTAATNCSTCHNGTSATGRPVSGTKPHTAAPMTNNTCGSCHTIGGTWAPATMNHTGATSCTSCHITSGNGFTPAKANHISTTGYTQCSSCHTTTVWAPSTFNHTGVTAATNCTTCHNGTNATGTPTGARAHTVAPMNSQTCGSCHAIGTVWAPTPMNHTGLTACSTCHSFAGNGWTPAKAGHISTTGYGECSSCHRTTAWLPTSFNHTNVTAATNCTTCHNGTNATGRPVSGAKAHVYAPMTSTTCGSCHTIGGAWVPATMNHTGVTSCTLCHSYSGNGFTPAKTNHLATSANCSDCHMTTAWLPTSFAHTTTQIAGKTCKDCHNGAGATGPSASHAGISPSPYNCDACHRTTAWAPATFAHTGVTTNCTNCHKTGFAPTKSASHFVTAQPCEKCHTTTAWAPIRSYVHLTPYYKSHPGLSMTLYADCKLCHIGNNEIISGAPHRGSATYKPDCAWCHSQQYKAGSHKKTQSPTTVFYTVAELKNCNGACHEYTNNSFTTVKTNRTGQHRSSDGGF